MRAAPVTTRNCQPRRRRRALGYSLLECLVAAAMLIAVMALAAQLYTWDARERREVWRRQVAQQEAANLLELLTAESPDAWSDEALAAVTLSAEAKAWLPQGQAHAAATRIATPLPGRRIDIDIIWQLDSGAVAAPVRLSGWVFPSGGAP